MTAVQWTDAGCGHERAAADPYVLFVIDLGGWFGWQLAEHRGDTDRHITSGQIPVGNDREAARDFARSLAELALDSRRTMTAQLAQLEAQGLTGFRIPGDVAPAPLTGLPTGDLDRTPTRSGAGSTTS